MELAEYSVFADKCFRDTPPPCAAVCPLAYDVREFIKQMRKGSLRSAYKIIRSSLIFPSVITRVCPETCRGACVRGRSGDESIDLKSLEQICVDKMAGKDPERYNIPQKPQKAAVIGAGLSGLACAYRLASFGYQVTVFEKESLLGGSLPEHVDRKWAHDEITREFKAVRCDFVMDTEVSPMNFPDADAVYIATGQGGAAFGDETSGDLSGGLSAGGIVIYGGALAGADLMESVRMGLTAAETINNKLLTSRKEGCEVIHLNAPERAADRRFYDLHYDMSVPEEIPEKGAPEAFRCMRCNCSECYDVCPLMEKHKQYPRKICNEVIVTLKPNKSRRTAVRLIMGCTECGLCREACPENIDMGKCLQEARTDFYESGVMSPAFHDYWIQDMEFCESDEMRVLVRKRQNDPADVLFFPGCQLSASMPEYTIRAYQALEKVCDNPAVLLGCCGVPAKWAGMKQEFEEVRKRILADWGSAGKPLVVTACPSCLENLRGIDPDMKIVSYYHFARQHPEMISAAGSGSEVRVLDPCSSVSDPDMADDVRKLLKTAGYGILNEEPEPGCCGFGGHIYNAARPTYEKFARHRLDNAQGAGIIATYCANCRDIFAAEGADARHVLGMILGMTEVKREPPELSDRRENRRTVRDALAGTGTDDTGRKGPMNEFEIYIPEELVRKMDRELLLREQVDEIIREAEATNNKIYDEDDNVFIAHKIFGTVTVWTVYRREAGRAEVEKVYHHRMEIREDQR